jgi:hypothetical protein
MDHPDVRKIWILGLLHSGTTVFWRAFGTDPRFLCFDEPLGCCEEVNAFFPHENSKRMLAALNGLCRSDPQGTNLLYKPRRPSMVDHNGAYFADH